MKVAVFDTHKFDRDALIEANKVFGHELHFIEPRLNKETAGLASGFPCVCVFVNDKLDEACLTQLAKGGTRLVALRSAGFNNVDIDCAKRLKIAVVRVPEYSPYAVAEHTVGLMLALNRKLHRAFNRVRDMNFSLDGLVGFDMHGKTVGVVGTGRIGRALVRILHGFGCKVLAYDLAPDEELVRLGYVKYVSLEEIYKNSRILTLHVPLTPKTHHLIGEKEIAMMQEGVMLINTSRGGLVNTKAVINALKRGHLGYAGLDVYEEEEGVFFQDRSLDLMQDDVLARLLTFPNVVITSHQAFLTKEALKNISDTTLQSIAEFAAGRPPKTGTLHC